MGLLSALIVLAGSATAVPASWAANTCGKPLVMSLGGACLAFAGFALLVASDDKLGTWAMIVPYLIVYGIGRGTWVCHLPHSTFLSHFRISTLFWLFLL